MLLCFYGVAVRWTSDPSYRVSAVRAQGLVDCFWMKLPGRVRDAVKAGVQRTLLRREWQKRPVYIVGCQRSGTSMLLELFALSWLTATYDERPESELFHNYRLRGRDRLREVIRKSPAPVTVLKPLCESQRIDRILDWNKNSVAIWIYRSYSDVADSAVRMWGGHHRRTIEGICAGEDVGWRGERIDEKTLERIQAINARELTDREGACLFWYIRNILPFRLGLVEDERVKLVRYEGLVSDPIVGGEEIFRFAGIPFSASWGNLVYSSSVSSERNPSIGDDVVELCSSLQAELDRRLNKSNG